MTTNTSLFAQILPMFTSQTERVATEALRHILQQSESARDALEQMLRTAGVEVESLTQFRTEATGDEGERVDLVCYDEHGTERVLIEAKFWAGLTDNQPNTYLDRMNANVPSVLLFVAPETRLERLWPEIRRRTKAKHSTVAGFSVGDARAVKLTGRNNFMMLTSWTHVLDTMSKRCNAQIGCDIAQLKGLAESMEKDRFLPWLPSDKSPDVPRKLRSLRRVIDGSVERATDHGRWLREQEARASSGVEYGRYVYLSEVGVWFGVDFDTWIEHGQSPLWVHLNEEHLPNGKKDLNRSVNSNEVERHKAFGNFLYFPIVLPDNTDMTGVIGSVVAQLNRIARLIDETQPAYEQD